LGGETVAKTPEGWVRKRDNQEDMPERHNGAMRKREKGGRSKRVFLVENPWVTGKGKAQESVTGRTGEAKKRRGPYKIER